ncbi:MAG: YihY family inner membrane protein [Pseudomonadota bacterium]
MNTFTGKTVRLWSFFGFLLRRFSEYRCAQAAAALSYTSLLALVPATAIGFTVFAIFPGLEESRDAVSSLLFKNFAPHMEEVIRSQLGAFAEKARRLTAVGTLFLFVTTVLLLSTIEKTFNYIWNVRTQRKLVPRLLAYWAVMTLGPVFIGAGLSISGYLFAATEWFGSERAAGIRDFVRFVPFLLETAGLALLYIVIPNREVPWRDALVGGVVAAVLFESAKKSFGLYLTYFPTYQVIYGALAAIPIFLIWMYISWLAVLVGGLVAASAGDWRKGAGEPS